MSLRNRSIPFNILCNILKTSVNVTTNFALDTLNLTITDSTCFQLEGVLVMNNVNTYIMLYYINHYIHICISESNNFLLIELGMHCHKPLSFNAKSKC